MAHPENRELLPREAGCLAGPPSLPGPAVQRRSVLRRRWFWLLSALLVISGAVVRLSLNKRPSVLLEGIDEVPAEMAALLCELDGVAQQLESDFPDSPGALYAVAQIHKTFGKGDSAIELWQRCLQIDPEFTDASESIGLTCLEMGQYAEAGKYLAEAARQNPNSSRHAASLGEALLGSGQVAEAVQVLEADVEKHPQAIASIALLGHAYVQLRHYDKAKETLAKAVTLAPEFTNAYHGLVTACVNLGQKEEAKRYGEKLVALKKVDEQAHRDRLKEDDLQRVRRNAAKVYVEVANEYIANGNTELAERYLFRSRELAPELPAACEVLSWLYVRQGRKNEAISMIQQMLAVGDNVLSAQMRAGSLLAELGDTAGAEKAYRRAIVLTPELAGGYAALAGMLAQQINRAAEAQTLARKAAELEPTPQYLVLLANASLAARDMASARDALERAMALAPTDAGIAQAYRMLGSQN